MGSKFEWIDNNPLVTFKGEVTFDELHHVDGKIFGDSRFDLMKYAIYNFLGVNSLNVTNNEIKIISTLDKSASRWNEKIKFACVVQEDHIKKAILDYIAFMEDSSWEIKYFNTVDEAIDWCKK